MLIFFKQSIFFVSLKLYFCKVYRGLGKPAELKTLKEYVQCARFSSSTEMFFMRIILRIIFYKLTIILNPQSYIFDNFMQIAC